MSPRSKDYGGLIKDIRASEVNKVQVAIADIDGILRGKFIHKEKFFSAADDGFGFCSVVFGWDSNDVCYDNTQFTGWHTGYPDVTAQIDLATCRRVPWAGGIPFFLADFETKEGKPLEICPRQLLKKVIDDVYTAGFLTKVGCEFEWFNFQETPDSLQEKNFQNLKPLTPGMFGYSLLRSGLQNDYFQDIMDKMEEFEVPLEGLHTETGPGVYEAAITASDALEAADRAALFKMGARKIANDHNILASFMARWNTELPGCSGHIHQSLMNGDGKPAFYDGNDQYKMSKTFKHYLAGILHCLPEILPMFAPNMNSFKRLVPGFWAPTHATWGVDNRTCALRVIPGSAKSTRVETRVGGSDINPYLGVAATLAAGLYGIRHQLELDQQPIRGNAYAHDNQVALPGDLLTATTRFRESQISRELFGDAFVDHFAATREWEWREAQKVVTDWELRRYFEII